MRSCCEDVGDHRRVAGEQAAVDSQDCSGDPRRFARCEKGNGGCDILDGADAAERVPLGELVEHVWVACEPLIPRGGADCARRNHVGPYPVAPVSDAERPGQTDQAGLGRAVGVVSQIVKAVHRAQVDDRAGAARLHVGQYRLAQKNAPFKVTSTSRSQSDSVRSSSGVSLQAAALLTSTSTGPRWTFVQATALTTLARSVTSIWRATALCPRSRILDAVASADGRSISATQTARLPRPVARRSPARFLNHCP